MTLKNTSHHTQRAKKLQKALSNLKLDALLVEDPTDLFYLTGIHFSVGKLLVTKEDALLLVDHRYLEMAKERSPHPAQLDTQEPFAATCQKKQIKHLGFDGRRASYDHFLHLKRSLPEIELTSAASFFKTMRVIKDEEELVILRKSAKHLWEGFEFIKATLKEGITELALVKAFEIHCLQKGADGLAFEPIIAFGKNGSMPHYRPQDVLLKAGDPVLIDIGVVIDGYHSDMTRVVFFKNEDPYISQLYEIAKRSQRAALALCRPGTTLKELDLAARAVMKQEKVEELFVHGLGHGVGLEIHEYPKIKYDNDDKDVVLEAGMVITIEPGLYVSGKGGVRYEDTIVITPSGYENFYPE
jgi:Xaa-Pro aminopeptidase